MMKRTTRNRADRRLAFPALVAECAILLGLLTSPSLGVVGLGIASAVTLVLAMSIEVASGWAATQCVAGAALSALAPAINVFGVRSAATPLDSPNERVAVTVACQLERRVEAATRLHAHVIHACLLAAHVSTTRAAAPIYPAA